MSDRIAARRPDALRFSSSATSKWSVPGATPASIRSPARRISRRTAALSGDRETATAQAAAECLRREGVKRVVGDRTLPLIFAHEFQPAGIAVECDTRLGRPDRRRKDAQEIQWLREAQQATEEAMRRPASWSPGPRPARDGVLLGDGRPLTSERLRAAIDGCLLERGYTNPPSIIAGGPQGADCHDLGRANCGPASR